ncbi:MAG: glycoside hydrolase family 97 catalytic domain-containing protein [Bacteroidales bacterium]|nr:glycoside hydrolase family 97 catalytic domain-containing protein [Bacteroidales bacterium]
MTRCIISAKGKDELLQDMIIRMRSVLIKSSHVVLFVLGISFSIECNAKQNQIIVKSPNGEMHAILKWESHNILKYCIVNSKDTLVLFSKMGITVDGVHLGDGVEFVERVDSIIDETFPSLWNKSAIVNHCNYSRIKFQNKSAALHFWIEIKSFNNGIAFRYVIPGKTERTIEKENTEFKIAGDNQFYYASGPFQYGWLQEYQKQSGDSINGELLAPPVTIERANRKGFLAISESGLSNYHGMVLLGSSNNTMQIAFVSNEGHLKTGKQFGLPESKYYHSVVFGAKWKHKGVIKSPWRVVMYGKDLNELVNNDIISSVAPKPSVELFPKGSNTDWIKPGRSFFTWLSERYQRKKNDLKTYRFYIDKASELGLEYVLVDEGWYGWKSKGKDNWEILSELVDYAKDRNVGIWVWKSSYERNDIPGFDDVIFRTDFVKRCAEIGVKGIKVDFFHTENYFTVQLMEDVLKDAAKYKQLVIFHGVNKPTGDFITYPNLLAKEAVRGLECVGGEDSWAPGPPWAVHNTTLPFTRLLAGPADYCPLHFKRFMPAGTTKAHQIASIYMFTSPMLILSCDPQDIEQSPAQKYITEVSVTWDETVVLPQSKIGALALIARRKGTAWYVSCLNGEKEMQLALKLDDFLPEAVNYKLELVQDKKKKSKVEVLKFQHNSSKALNLNLRSGGGFLLKVIPIEQ